MVKIPKKLLTITTVFSVLLTLVVLVISFSGNTLGQSAQPLPYCQTEFAVKGVQIFYEFEEEMKSLSQNTQVVTEQLEDAFGSYRNLQADLNNAFKIAQAGVDTSQDVVYNITSLDGCRSVVTNINNNAQEILSSFLKKTAGRKQSLALVEQYQALIGNSERLIDELRDLNGNMLDFTESVPCFADVCVTR